MNIGLMRLVDYWLGVPLCFALSIVDVFVRLTGLGRQTAKLLPRKIAFIKLSEMGAIILAYPLLTAAKKELPQADIFFVTFRRNRSVFSLFPGLVKDSNIITIRESGPFAFIADTFAAIRRLRREKIEVLFDLEFFSRFTAILSYLSAAKKRVGFYRYNYEGLYRGSLFTHRLQYNPLLHISRSYLSLWQALKTDKKVSPELAEKVNDKDIVLPQPAAPAEMVEKTRAALRQAGIGENSRVFLLNPGEGMLALREWPLENFACLAKKILADNRNAVVLVGTKEAAKKGGLLLEAIGSSRCTSLIAKTEVPDLLALFSISEALIANDCGLAHIAGLSTIKKFIIFGPESPAVFGPLGKNNFVFYSGLACSPCLSALNHRKSSCRDSRCLKAISPDSVYNLILQNLRE
ncbi:MAG: glycosyltransferase family 9 protein [Candidatus Omnitrophota bacterium]